MSQPKRITPFPSTDCDETNRLGFEKSGDIDTWVNQECPGVHVIRKWVCKCCGRWHYEGTLSRTPKQAEQAAVKSGMQGLKELGESL